MAGTSVRVANLNWIEVVVVACLIEQAELLSNANINSLRHFLIVHSSNDLRFLTLCLGREKESVVSLLQRLKAVRFFYSSLGRTFLYGMSVVSRLRCTRDFLVYYLSYFFAGQY